MPEPKYPINYVNGLNSNTVSPSNRGLAYGDGVFETILMVRGEVPLWPLHHKRLLKSLLALEIAVEPARIRQALDTALDTVKTLEGQLFVVKMIITRGEGGRGYQSTRAVKSTLITQLFPLSIDSDKYNGVSVHVCKQVLYPVAWAGLKTLNQLPYVLASNERLETDYDEGILFSNEGLLIEATARNVFIVKDEKIITPLLTNCGVKGVLRQSIIDDIAAKVGLSVIERAITEAEFFNADEVFLSNTITGIWPVISCEQKQWPIGPVTRSLQSIYNSIFIDEF